jgi:hypothetical protein
MPRFDASAVQYLRDCGTNGIRIERTDSTRVTRMARCEEWCANRYTEHDSFRSPNAPSWDASRSDSGLKQVVAASILNSAPAYRRQQQAPIKSTFSIGATTCALQPLSLVEPAGEWRNENRFGREPALGGSAGGGGVSWRGPGRVPVVGCLLDLSAEAAGIRASSRRVVSRVPGRYPYSYAPTCCVLQRWLN